MFAQLGAIEFEILNAPVQFSESSGCIYAEHSVIEGRPLLQFTGTGLKEIEMKIALHHSFADVRAGIEALEAALLGRSALSLVMGDGTNKGSYVIEQLAVDIIETAENGTPRQAEASLRLKYNASRSVS